MITPRWINVRGLPSTIMPPPDACANVASARSISPASRTSTGRSSTPSDGVSAWIAPNWPGPAAMLESRRTATRVTRGATSLSSSSHLPPMELFVDGKSRGVAARPRQALDVAGRNRVADTRKHDRYGARRLQQWREGGAGGSQDDIGLERDQLGRVFTYGVGLTVAPAIVDLHILPDRPA